MRSRTPWACHQSVCIYCDALLHAPRPSVTGIGGPTAQAFDMRGTLVCHMVRKGACEHDLMDDPGISMPPCQ